MLLANHFAYRRFILFPLLLSINFSFMPNTSFGSAFAVNEQGATGSSTALAGVAAASEDISLSYWNPALLTNTQTRSFYINGTYITADFNLSNVSGTDVTKLYTSNTQGSDPLYDKLVPAFYYVAPISDKALFGFSLNLPFAANTNYDDDWAGRYYSTATEVKDISAAFSGAYRVNDKLDIGASIQFHYSSILLETAINDFDGTSGYGSGKIDMDDELSFGYALGARSKFSETRQIGIGYRSKVKTKLTGTARFSDLSLAAQSSPYFISDTNASASSTLPDILTLSYLQEVNNKLSLGVTAMKTGWGDLQSLTIKYESDQADSVIPLNYQDAWLYSLGLTYQYSPQLTLKGGYALDHAATKEEDASPVSPDSDKQWFTVGARYQTSERQTFILQYGYLRADKILVYRDGEGDDAGKGEFTGNYKLRAHNISLAFNQSF